MSSQASVIAFDVAEGFASGQPHVRKQPILNQYCRYFFLLDLSILTGFRRALFS
jgi:hypothetical protein